MSAPAACLEAGARKHSWPNEKTTMETRNYDGSEFGKVGGTERAGCG